MFSQREQLIIGIIGDRKKTIKEITSTYTSRYSAWYGATDANSIASSIRRIKLKCDANQTTWTITGKGLGRGGRTVWRTSRKKLKRTKHS